MARNAALPLVLALCCATAGCQSSTQARSAVLATTTSTQDTGLLDVLVPLLGKERGIELKVVAVGSGEALAMGRRGDADVLLVHSPRDEETFMAEGFGALRLPVMHNDFVLAGSAADAAGAKGLEIVAAMQRIAAAQAPWVSRGDRSGTHKREIELWRKAGLAEASWPKAISTGQGMGETARIAAERGAYVLMDRGTFLALRATLALVVIVDSGPDLVNRYSVIVVDAKKAPRVHLAEAKEVASWLVSPSTQVFIGELGKDKFGQPLFVPDAH